MVLRRDFLRTLSGSLVVTGAATLAPRLAFGSDLSLSDRIDLLYSNKFGFDADGLPQVSIGLMEGQDEVRLEGRSGVSALPSGDGGTAIEGGRRWRIRLARGRASQQRFSVALESLPATDLRAVDKASHKWRKRGFDVREEEVGTLFGVKGRALDTRRILLTTGDFSSEADAEREARVLIQRHDAMGRLHPRVDKRAEGRIVAEDLDTGIKIRAEGVMWFAPKRGEQLTVRNVLTGVTMGTVKKVDRSYRGQIYVTIDRNGKLAVVNLVNEIDVLSGLVPAEIFASSAAAALEAQSIAARGQLLTKIGSRHLDDPFLLCAHQHCQVYAGSGREHHRTNAAVRRTKGRVLMRPNGSQLVDTVYSANSGGHSEDNELVWPSPVDDQLRGRPDPLAPSQFQGGITGRNLADWILQAPRTYSTPASDHMAESYRWQTTVDPYKIAGRVGIPKALGKVEKLEVLKRGRSGRVIALRLHAARGEQDVYGELKIRRALGNLRSSLFLIQVGRSSNGHFRLAGGGHGHGVGMCQHGAMGMAKAGKSHSHILAHYYRGSQLLTLW
jgi:SpoIID/LytB domain protein